MPMLFRFELRLSLKAGGLVLRLGPQPSNFALHPPQRRQLQLSGPRRKRWGSQHRCLSPGAGWLGRPVRIDQSPHQWHRGLFSGTGRGLQASMRLQASGRLSNWRMMRSAHVAADQPWPIAGCGSTSAAGPSFHLLVALQGASIAGQASEFREAGNGRPAFGDQQCTLAGLVVRLSRAHRPADRRRPGMPRRPPLRRAETFHSRRGVSTRGPGWLAVVEIARDAFPVHRPATTPGLAAGRALQQRLPQERPTASRLGERRGPPPRRRTVGIADPRTLLDHFGLPARNSRPAGWPGCSDRLAPGGAGEGAGFTVLATGLGSPVWPRSAASNQSPSNVVGHEPRRLPAARWRSKSPPCRPPPRRRGPRSQNTLQARWGRRRRGQGHRGGRFLVFPAGTASSWSSNPAPIQARQAAARRTGPPTAGC